MDKIAQKTIVDGMLAFKPSIVFTTSSNPTETVKAAINSNPKSAYYLHGYSISGMMNRYEVRSQYIHKDTKGKSHQIQSRNLVPPKEKVRELGKRKIKEIETGAVPKAPKGYYLHEADYSYNDYDLRCRI